MGIKTVIKKEQLPLKYQKYNLIETTHGNTDSVYLLDDKYVIKLYENTQIKTIKNEQILLKKLQKLKVPQLIEIIKIDDKNIAIFTQMIGKSIEKPTTNHIKQIGLFLKEFHQISQHLSSSNKQIYTTEYLTNILKDIDDKSLQQHFKNINIELQNNGIIHGDIFYDNAKFLDDNLNGVYDFSEACVGDFIFELAVIAISWCYEKDKINKNKLDALLSSYNLDISYTQFKEYIKYGLVYYATLRYIDNRDYQELLNRLDNI